MRSKGEFGEPWFASKRGMLGGVIEATRKTPGSLCIAQVHFRENEQEMEATRARIVSCVNALSGMDPAGVAPLIEAAKLAYYRLSDKTLSDKFRQTANGLEAALKALGVSL